MYRTFNEWLDELYEYIPEGFPDDFIYAAQMGWNARELMNDSKETKSEGYNGRGPTYL
jgi:hypothetical protein